MDTISISSTQVLHIVDEGSRFSAEKFVPEVSTKTLWATTLECWEIIHTVLPNSVLLDQERYDSNGFGTLGVLSNLNVKNTGLKNNNSLKLCKCNCQPISKMFRKFMSENSKSPSERTTPAVFKAINDSLGPEGLVPFALVFGEIPPAFTKLETPLKRSTQMKCASVVTFG